MKKIFFMLIGVLLCEHICMMEVKASEVFEDSELTESREILLGAKEYAQEVWRDLVEMVNHDYLEQNRKFEVTDMEALWLAEPYYIYDPFSQVQIAEFYFPICDDDDIILMLRLNYIQNDWYEILNFEYVDVLNELDYLHEDYIFYIDGKCIYAECQDKRTRIAGDESDESSYSELDYQVKKSDVEAGYQNMSCLKNEYEIYARYSECYESIKLEDAIAFAEEIYRYFCMVSMTCNKAEISSYYLGKPMIAYNVDGETYAVTEFPIYDDDDEVVTTMRVFYEDNRWTINWVSTNCVFDSTGPKRVLNEYYRDEYENEEVIVYTINNRMYIETKDKCAYYVLAGWHGEGEEDYTIQEQQFMKMSWNEKKNLVQQGIENWVAFSASKWREDDDYGRLVSLIGGGGGNYQEVKKIKFNAFIAGGIVLLAGMLVILTIMIRTVIKKKNEIFA